MTSLQDIEARREARKAQLESAKNEQIAIDLEAIDALEVEHGDSNIAIVEVPFTSGLPVMCAVRTPKPVELKRYRDRLRKNKDQQLEAAQELAAVTWVYPSDKDVQKQVLEARPGIDGQLGVTALQLALGKTEDDAKK